MNRLHQQGDICLPTVQLLREVEAIRHIDASEVKGVDAPTPLPFIETSSQIGPEPDRALVTLFRGFGKKLHDDARKHLRDLTIDIAGRDGDARHVAVDELQGVTRLKRRPADQHFIQGDAERVEISPVIDRMVHASGLFRGNILDRSFQEVGIARTGILPG